MYTHVYTHVYTHTARLDTHVGTIGDPDAWNSSSYDMAGAEYSGANGFAVTGVPSLAPTGGMSAAGCNTLQRDRERASERASERECVKE